MMFKKILNYGVVIALALVLVGGSIYILARPTNEESVERDLVHEASHENGQSTTDGNGNSNGNGSGNGNSAGSSDENNGNADRDGTGNNSQSNYNDAELIAMETIEGTVTESGNELLVETAAGEVLVGLGPAFYREEAEFTVDVGDEVTVTGYEEDDEFKASLVENLSQKTSIVLRDASGRPMWSGRGNQQNRQ